MFTSKQFRAKAAEYGKLAKGAGEPRCNARLSEAGTQLY